MYPQGTPMTRGLEDLISYKSSRELQGLTPLLRSWTEVVMDYCRSDKFEDNPWWYNERASLSTLAGAAWRLKGWQALEEFSTTKRGTPKDSPNGPVREKRGRCDLLVAHGTTGFAMESKQAWPVLGKGLSRLNNAAEAAKKDAGNLTANQADHRIGLVFAAPYIPVKAVAKLDRLGNTVVDTTAVHGFVREWIKEVRPQDYDAHAYVFPKRCQHFTAQKHPKVYPGVLLLMTLCKTGTRHSRS